ncbi:hypothetical protein EDC01DRAFT_485823 [Geopyxis carbonaria]|nr:hypothetical protein EDC01DRAFT_485823 [Geopyxis carbonaria]
MQAAVDQLNTYKLQLMAFEDGNTPQLKATDDECKPRLENATIAEHEIQANRSNAKIAALEQQLQDYGNRVKATEQTHRLELQALEHTHRLQIKAAKEDLAKYLFQLKATEDEYQLRLLNALKRHIEAKETEIGEKFRAAADWHKLELEALKEKLNAEHKLQNQANQALISSHEAELCKLHSERKSLVLKLEAAESTLKASNETLDNLRVWTDQYQDQISELENCKNDLSLLKQENFGKETTTGLLLELRNLQHENALLHYRDKGYRELVGPITRALCELDDNKLDDIKPLVEALQDAMVKHEKYTKAHLKIHTLRKKLATLSSELASIDRDKGTEIAFLREELAEMQTQLGAAHGLRDDIARLEKEKDQLLTKFEASARLAQENANRTRTALRAEVETRNRRIEELESVIGSVESVIVRSKTPIVQE